MTVILCSRTRGWGEGIRSGGEKGLEEKDLGGGAVYVVPKAISNARRQGND